MSAFPHYESRAGVPNPVPLPMSQEALADFLAPVEVSS
jgi:hypothetical protein